MIKLRNDVAKSIIEKFSRKNSFKFTYPLIVVIRNCQFNDEVGNTSYVPNNGHNNCDAILLCDKKETLAVHGRTIPHEKYMKQVVQGKMNANYIVSGYYKDALKKGKHKGISALVQNKPFIIYRSVDEAIGNEDDYISKDGFVYDNLHGNAPYSAGCITIEGSAKISNGTEIHNGDWRITHDWLYNKHVHSDTFGVCIMLYTDLIEVNRTLYSLRPGSTGHKVKKLQNNLGIKADGIFGRQTFNVLMQQGQRNIFYYDKGIF